MAFQNTYTRLGACLFGRNAALSYAEIPTRLKSESSKEGLRAKEEKALFSMPGGRNAKEFGSDEKKYYTRRKNDCYFRYRLSACPLFDADGGTV